MIQPTKQHLKEEVLELTKLLQRETKNIIFHQDLTEQMRTRMLRSSELNNELHKRISILEDTIEELKVQKKTWLQKIFSAVL